MPSTGRNRLSGTGWSANEKYIFDEELERAGALNVVPMGLLYVGPVIYTFGTEEQKQRWLPGILDSTTFWAQGYSEPGSGSDLASLQASAVADGNDYIVNGTKIWTSLGQHADWIFCLLRTSQEEKKQEGITFLLIDMKTPGITVQPIITIDGKHALNSVVFEDVRVPQANRIGEEGKGWTYANYPPAMNAPPTPMSRASGSSSPTRVWSPASAAFSKTRPSSKSSLRSRRGSTRWNSPFSAHFLPWQKVARRGTNPRS